MIKWLDSLGKEARALGFFTPLLIVSALVGAGAATSQAAERLSQSPVSPLSPVATPQSGVTALGLQNYWWILGIAVLVVAIIGLVWWLRPGRGRG